MANTRGKSTVSGKKTVRHLNNRPASLKSTRSGSAAVRKKRTVKSESENDYSFVLILLFLLGIGLVMLYSTSSYEAALQHDGDDAFYLKKQALFTVGGLVIMYLTAGFVRMSTVKRFSWIVYGISIVLLILLPFVGTEVNGATRWIYIGPVSIQPAEISKLAVILTTAKMIDKFRIKEVNDFVHGFCRIMLWALVQAIMIKVLSDNLSSAIIVMLIALGMYYLVYRRHRLYVALTAIALGGSFAVVKYVSSAGELASFRLKRILVWLDPVSYSDDTGYQTLQALYGIGSGGMFGKGLGQSMQKLGKIPEAQNDMIFSIICEEIGVIGAAAIIILYIMLCWRIMIIVSNAKDLYSSMVAAGIMIQIAVQAILNIAVVTNTIPNTGVSLPFISYGGSSVMTLLFEIGLVLNIQRSITQQA